MSVLICRVNLSSSMARGVSCPTTQPVAIECDPAALSVEDRATIASRLDQSGYLASRCESGGTYCLPQTPLTVPEPTIAGVLEAIRAEDEAVRTYADRKAAEKAADAERDRADSLERAQSPHEGDVREWVYMTDLGRVIVQSYRLDQSYWGRDHIIGETSHTYPRRWQQHLPSKEVQESPGATHLRDGYARDEELARDEALRASKAALHADDETRRQWIARHGSGRLRRLIAEGIHHQSVYLAERGKWEQSRLEADLAQHRPEWVAVAQDDLETDLADVGLRGLSVLDAARVVAPGCRLARRKSTRKLVAWEEYTTSYGLVVVICWPREDGQ